MLSTRSTGIRDFRARITSQQLLRNRNTAAKTIPRNNYPRIIINKQVLLRNIKCRIMNDNFNATSAFFLSLFLSLCDKFIQREISVRDVQRFPGFQPELNICRILTIECL